MTDFDQLVERFDALDEQIAELEAALAENTDPELGPVLEQAGAIVRDMLHAFGAYRGREMPDTDDLLDVLKAFVKGDPSLNAVRDNVRELVYYGNCLDMDRRDALPARPGRMAVRTVRHIYLYLRTRLINDSQSRDGAKPLRPM